MRFEKRVNDAIAQSWSPFAPRKSALLTYFRGDLSPKALAACLFNVAPASAQSIAMASVANVMLPSGLSRRGNN
jgi:hypothetical protein